MNYLDSCRELISWHTPATDYPEQQYGSFRIKRTAYAGHYQNWGIDGYIFFRAKKRIPITTLQELRGKTWHTWMVDDPPQWRAMEIYAEQSEGDILCAGLGLGLILHALARNDKVKSVTCVELNSDVIELIFPYIDKLSVPVSIVQEDFYDYVRRTNGRWGGIIADLWVANKETKMGIYFHEVLPFAAELGLKYPNTPITFHGFQTISDIKPVSPEMVKQIMEMNDIIGR